MRADVVQSIAALGVLARPDAVDAIEAAVDPGAALAAVVDHLRAMEDVPMALAAADVERILQMAGDPGPASSAPAHPAGPSRASALRMAAQVSADIQVSKDPTGESTCEGRLEDFTRYFHDRFVRLRKLLRARRESSGAQEIARLRARAGGVRAIGMVGDIQRPAGGGLYFDLEDETGSVRCVCGKRGQVPTDMVNDEVVLVAGNLAGGSSDPALFVDEIVRPDVPSGGPVRRAAEDVAAAFISDVHVGSKTFLDQHWQAFLDWLNGRGSRDLEMARKVKYLVISGDLVDGIGVFPNQEHALSISDLAEQYDTLAGYLQQLPDHLEVIMLPGNHDGVRPAEPQPALPERTRRAFDSNVRFLGNPSEFSLHGVRVLAYHGRSFDDLVTNVQGMSYRTPLDMMELLLRKRHLAPIYGDKTPLAPEHRDWLVIDEVPDIFVTGHVHLTGARPYKSVTLLHDSAWQAQTEFQRMMNIVPDPARVPVVNLRTRDVALVQF
jgi:DNA polymerase II small subunit